MAKSRRRKCVCGEGYVTKGRKYCFNCEPARDPLPPPSFRDIKNATKDSAPQNSQVIFAFRNRISKQKKDIILEKIRSWKDVESVEQVFDETDTNISSVELHVVYVKTSKQVDVMANKLQSLAEIKYAYAPPTRKPK